MESKHELIELVGLSMLFVTEKISKNFFSLKLSEHIHIPNIQCIIAFTAFKLMKNVHFKAIFRILPISIVENWNFAWIDKNTHISGSINATEMCQYFLESSDHGLQLLWRWTYSSEAQEAVNWPPKVKDSKIGGPPLDGCRKNIYLLIFNISVLGTLYTPILWHIKISEWVFHF